MASIQFLCSWTFRIPLSLPYPLSGDLRSSRYLMFWLDSLYKLLDKLSFIAAHNSCNF